MTNSEKAKLLDEIHGLMQPYRKQAKEVNFGSASKRESEHTLTIVGATHTIKIQVI